MRRSSLILIPAVSGLLLQGCSPKESPVDAKPPTTVAVSPAQTEAVKKGPGRVPVEHGLDEDVAKVDTTPKTISVEDLLAVRDTGTSKIDLAGYHSKRVAPFETTTYEVAGTIKNIKHEKDGDFYFVLEGKTGAQAVIEVPDPALCKGSPLLPQIVAAREALDKKYHPTDVPKDLNDPITVDGVGFLGSHRKKGSGSFGSSVRLMPGIGVKFGDGKAESTA